MLTCSFLRSRHAINVEDTCGQEICANSCNASNVLDEGKPQTNEPTATGQDPHGQHNTGTIPSVASGGDKHNSSSSNATGQNLNQQKNAATYAAAALGGGKPKLSSNGAEVRDYTVAY